MAGKVTGNVAADLAAIRWIESRLSPMPKNGNSSTHVAGADKKGATPKKVNNDIAKAPVHLIAL
jgi:hypothetical protein